MITVSTSRPRNVDVPRAAAILYGDWGTSKAYVVGLAFAVLFVWFGVQRLDAQAKGAGIGFRLLILSGVAAFWPLFLRRWLQRMAEPPIETNSHRRAGGL